MQDNSTKHSLQNNNDNKRENLNKSAFLVFNGCVEVAAAQKITETIHDCNTEKVETCRNMICATYSKLHPTLGGIRIWSLGGRCKQDGADITDPAQESLLT